MQASYNQQISKRPVDCDKIAFKTASVYTGNLLRVHWYPSISHIRSLTGGSCRPVGSIFDYTMEGYY